MNDKEFYETTQLIDDELLIATCLSWHMSHLENGEYHQIICDWSYVDDNSEHRLKIIDELIPELEETVNKYGLYELLCNFRSGDIDINDDITKCVVYEFDRTPGNYYLETWTVRDVYNDGYICQGIKLAHHIVDTLNLTENKEWLELVRSETGLSIDACAEYETKCDSLCEQALMEYHKLADHQRAIES